MKILKNKFFILGLILIFIFLILSVVFGYFYVRYYGNINNTSKNKTYDFQYKLVDLENQPYDKKITIVNKTTNKEIILIESIKTAVPELQTKFNKTFIEFAFPEDSKKIFLKEVLADTDNLGGILWSFDIEMREFKKLQTNEFYDGFGGQAISPNKKMVVIALTLTPESWQQGDVKTLRLLDLEGDDSKILVTLEKNETFNSGYGGLLGDYEIKWLDNLIIEYSVFNQIEVDDKVKKPLIEKRKIKI